MDNPETGEKVPDVAAMLKVLWLSAAVGFAATAAWLWLLPVEVFQRGAVERAAPNEYAQYEASGQAEFLVWVGRAALPVLAAASFLALRQSPVTADWLRAVGRGLAGITAFGPPRGCAENPPSPDVWTVMAGTWLLRGFAAACVGLFAVHVLRGLEVRGRDWAYFRFRSGEEVLPNISFENRDVIRYLQTRTPEHARLFAYSDQRLFFLSYYLRPRRLFLRIHPAAQFVIPQPGQERPLPAYRRGDLPQTDEQRIRPDFVLEYFEGPAYVDSARLGEDRAWVEFWRRSRGERGLPPYLVVVTPIGTETLP